MIAQLLSRIRRNHGLEHATIHMLTARHQKFSAQGNSDHRGFSLNVFGDVSEDDVRAAVREAYSRLKAGEHQLAVHPNCGTVLLTTAAMVTVASQAMFSLEQRRQGVGANRFSVLFNAMPAAVLMTVFALIASRPIGIQLQERYTTEGDLGPLQVVSINRVSPSLVTRLFQLLLTSGRGDMPSKAYRIETSDFA